MSNKQSLQNIWAITDKALIDAVKKKNSPTIGLSKNQLSDSDSDDSIISRSSFVAVPDEFRPLFSKNKSCVGNKTGRRMPPRPNPSQKEESNRYTPPRPNPSQKEESNRYTPPRPNPSQKEESNRYTPPRPNPSQKEESNRYTPPRPNPSQKEESDRYTPLQMREKDVINRFTPPQLGEKEETSKISLNHCSKTSLGPNSRLNENLNAAKYKQTKPLSPISTDEDNSSIKYSAKYTQRNIRSSNPTFEVERSRKSPQDLRNLHSVQNTARATNCKSVRFTTQEWKDEILANDSLLQEKRHDSVAKSKKSEHGRKEGRVLTLNFEFPLSEEKISVSKEGVKYEAKFLRDTKPETFKKEKPERVDSVASSQKNVIRWDSTLKLGEQNDSYRGTVARGVIHLKKSRNFRKRRNRGNEKNKKVNNECQTVEETREDISEPEFDSSLLDKSNLNHRRNQNVLPKESGFFNSDTTYCKNDFSTENNLNYIANIQNNSQAKADSLNEKNLIQKYNTNELTHKQRIYPSVPNILQENLEELFIPKAKNADKEQSLLQYGKDMTDLIIGSHTTLSLLISIYNEWKGSRLKLIEHFEQLEKNLKDSSRKFTKYSDIIRMAKQGVTIAAVIPHTYVAIAANIVSVLTNLFSAFLDKSNKGNVNDSNDITTYLFKDSHTSTELYAYGLQCNQQFEETTELIAEFHSKVSKNELFTNENPEIVKFVEGVLEYKPTHRVFYKKIHKCFQELLQRGTSSFAKNFCEPFQLYNSTAVDVIGHLDWRFRYEDFNCESVRYELEQLHPLIEDSNRTSVIDLVKRIQNCIRHLRDEFIFVERCFKDVSIFEN